ncbi:MAG: Citrate synthase 1 [Candidatus Omnitrophica bacterium]|nr:Citrate synthase 1 [Candidatus Omnitrophota bacterium]
MTFKKISDAEIKLDGKTYKYPVYEGTEGERSVDVGSLRNDSGHITLDVGYGNTGACTSAITFIDGEKGILRYRGIPIQELAERSSFLEVSYLLIYGHLPSAHELKDFATNITRHTMIHEDMKRFFNGYPPNAHPMSVLSSMIVSLSSYYPDCMKNDPGSAQLNIYRLLSKVATIAAFSYKKSIGQPFVGPLNRLGYVENFLHMMFSVPAEPYEVDPVVARALEKILVLHADHEQNCSTSTVRLVGSSQANIYASISAGICALWGPLHGGANQAVLEMLEYILDEGGDVQAFIQKVKDKKAGDRLMGFGHRVYKNFDPRAVILKAAADEVLAKLKVTSPLLDVAKALEAGALKDPYFAERKLYPNVDFYSGIILRAIGIPLNMFTVMFAIGRLPGWIAQWKEQNESGIKIGRPRQVYTGPALTPYVPVDRR